MRGRVSSGFALLFALAACTGGAQNEGVKLAQAAAVASGGVLAPAQAAKVAATCNAAQPLLAAATAPGAPAPVSGGAVYPAAYCQQLAQLPAGQVPATTDAGTPAWLDTTLKGVAVAAQVARYVLPAVLPLLL